jgi:hypothetical protein
MLAGAAGTTAAHAQSIGYVGTLGGSISPAVSYNSAGGTNSLAVIGTRVYQVTLGGLGNSLHSNVQVNAVNTNGHGHYCTSDGWFSPNNVDVTADVACFDALGNPLAADFTLLYQARTSAPPHGKIASCGPTNPISQSARPIHRTRSTASTRPVPPTASRMKGLEYSSPSCRASARRGTRRSPRIVAAPRVARWRTGTRTRRGPISASIA